MDEAQQIKKLLIDDYATAILNGFCANQALVNVPEQDLVTKAFDIARLCLRQRMISGQPMPISVFYVMQKERYLRNLDMLSKTVGYIGNVREGYMYFDEATATHAAQSATSLGNPGYVRTGTAEVFPHGRVIPQPVEDWKEQAEARGDEPLEASTAAADDEPEEQEKPDRPGFVKMG